MIVKVSPDMKITVYSYPEKDELKQLREMIGCQYAEHVRPQFLYKLFGFNWNPNKPDAVGMLIDEEGKLRGKRVNQIASALYSPIDPIVGDVIFVGEHGEEFCGLDEEIAARLINIIGEVKREWLGIK